MDGARRAIGKGVLTGILCDAYPKWEAAFGRGCFRGIGREENSHDGWQFRMRERLRPAFEESLAQRSVARLASCLLGAPLRLIASFFASFALSALGWRWLLLSETPDVNEVWLSLLVFIVALPAHASQKTLWQALEESVFLGGLQKEAARAHLSQPYLKEENGITVMHGARTLLASSMLGVLAARWSVGGILLLFAILFLLLWVWQSPELGILLLLAVFPFVHLFSHPATVLIALALFIELSYFAKALVGRRVMRFGTVDFLTLLFAVCYLSAALVGSGGRSGLLAGVGRFVAVLFWFPARNLLGQKRWRERIFFGVALSATFCAAIGIYQYFFGKSELNWVDVARFSDIGGRVTSTFTNPNVLAVYLLTVLPVCLSVCLARGRRHGRRGIGALSLGAVLLCIVLTWTRGAWLAAPIGLLIFLLCYSRRTAATTLLLSVPLLSLVPWLPKNILNRFSSIGRLADSSTTYRIYTWRGTTDMILRHPWGIGTGECAFSARYPDFAISGTESVPHAHHLFLQVTAELGVAGGLTLCVIVVGVALAFCYGLSRLHGEGRLSLLTGACAIVGCLILGLFDYIWYSPDMTLLFFCWAGLTLAVPDRYLAKE